VGRSGGREGVKNREDLNWLPWKLAGKTDPETSGDWTVLIPFVLCHHFKTVIPSPILFFFCLFVLGGTGV
jgi:hypothetical protein